MNIRLAKATTAIMVSAYGQIKVQELGYNSVRDLSKGSAQPRSSTLILSQVHNVFISKDNKSRSQVVLNINLILKIILQSDFLKTFYQILVSV